MRFIPAALCLLIAATAALAQSPGKPARSRKPAVLGTPVDGDGDWTQWLFKTFPPSVWPQDASDSFAARFKGKWDSVTKRDFHGDGLPTALLIRGIDAPSEEGQLIATEVLIVKWIDGDWKELLRMDLKNGLSLGEKKIALPRPAGSRGYEFQVIAESASRSKKGEPGAYKLGVGFAACDRKGEASDDATLLRYSSADRSYKLEGAADGE